MEPRESRVPDWTPRDWPQPVTLTGRYVTVLPLEAAAYSDLFAATCGPEDDALWTYRTIERPASLPTLWMHLAELVDSPVDVTFALVPTEGAGAGRAAGIASYLRIEPEHGRLELGGVLLGGPLRRTRAATEAIHLLLRHAFDELGYRRVAVACDSLDEPARRAAARLGFIAEGRFRSHLVVKGRSRDTDWLAITAAEWPAVRAAHGRWLDPANFDAGGHQRTALSELTAR